MLAPRLSGCAPTPVRGWRYDGWVGEAPAALVYPSHRLLTTASSPSCLPAAPTGGPAVARLTARGTEGTARVPGLLGGLHGQPLTSMQVERGTLALPSLPALGSSLTSLTVRRCELYGSFGSLSKLTALRSLSLESCGLTRVPRALAALSAMSELVLDHNELGPVKSLRLVLPQLTQLRALGLSGCKLDRFPAGVVGLTCLTRLDLSFSSFSDGLEQLAALTQLASLDLEEMPWETLPMALSALTNLTWLSLQRCGGCGLTLE